MGRDYNNDDIVEDYQEDYDGEDADPKSRTIFWRYTIAIVAIFWAILAIGCDMAWGADLTQTEAGRYVMAASAQGVAVEDIAGALASTCDETGDANWCEVAYRVNGAACERAWTPACKWKVGYRARVQAARGEGARRALRFLGAVGDSMVASQQQANQAFRPMVLCRQTQLGVVCQ